MGKFEPHFYVTGENTNGWQEILSYEINDRFFAGEVITENEYFTRMDGIRSRLMYMLTFDNGKPKITFVADEWGQLPEIWYAYSVRENGFPPNIYIMAFATTDFLPGEVVSVKEAAEKGLSPSQQIAAIQWGYRDPKMHQIFVHPDWRRKRIAGAMIGAADLVNLSGNFSPGVLLYGGDVTTSNGEHLREAWSSSPRVMPRQGIVGVVGLEPTLEGF